MIFDLSEEPEEEEEDEEVSESPPELIFTSASQSQSGDMYSQCEELHVPSPKCGVINKKRKKKSPSDKMSSEEKAKAKEDKRIAKASAKEMVKQTKEHEKTIALQKHGYFKMKEITLVLSDDIYDSPVGAAIIAHLMFSTKNDDSYGCVSAPSTVPGLCRWTYRNYLDGGNATVGDAGTTVIPFVVIVFPAQSFLKLVDESPNGVDFPALEAQIQGFRSDMIKDLCPPHSKMVLLLMDFDKEKLQYQQNNKSIKKSKSEISVKVREAALNAKIDEAVGFLLYTANVDVVLRLAKAEQKHVAQYFDTVTRSLGDQASTQKRISGLETIKRIPSEKSDISSGESEKTNKYSSEDVQLQEIFCCMLQAVPGMSRAKAECLQKKYPYPQLLLDALSDSSVTEEDRKKLLADKFDPQRNNFKLAAQMYKIYTSLSADEAL